MFDVSKLSVKALGVIAAAAALIVVIVFTFSFVREQPVYFWGKEFGFSSKELQEKNAALAAELAQAKNRAEAAEAEVAQLKQANAGLLAEQQRRRQHELSLWNPVDEVDFHFDGTYSASDGGRQGQGKWTHKESELALELIDADSDEAVLRTNLPEPDNKIRLKSAGLLIRMNKYEYALSTRFTMSDYVRIRIERRRKM